MLKIEISTVQDCFFVQEYLITLYVPSTKLKNVLKDTKHGMHEIN